MATASTTRPNGLRWRDLRTGLLFLTGLALVGSLALIISKNTGAFTTQSKAYFFVPDIKGLTEGNLVSISGKKVGVISGMEFVKRADTPGIVIEMSIRQEYFGLLTSDSKAQIKSLGILGDKYVDLTRGRSNKQLAENDSITVAVEPGMEELTASALTTIEKVGKLTDNFTEMAESINRGEGTIGRLMVSTELNDRLASTLAGADAVMNNLNTTTNRINRGEGLLPRLISDRELPDRITSLLKRLDEFTAALSSDDGTLGKLIKDETLYQNFNALANRLDTMVVRFNNPDGTLGRFSTDPQLYDNLNSSVRSLDSLLLDLKENPGRYISIRVF